MIASWGETGGTGPRLSGVESLKDGLLPHGLLKA